MDVYNMQACMEEMFTEMVSVTLCCHISACNLIHLAQKLFSAAFKTSRVKLSNNCE